MMMQIDRLGPLFIGREADGSVQIVEIDCAAWRRAHPNLIDYRVEVTSPAGVVYLPAVHMEGDVLVWPITQNDTAKPGQGLYQVVATGAEGERKTSSHPVLTVMPIMDGTVDETMPDPVKPWVDQMFTEINNKVDAALTSAKESGEFDGTDGYTPVRGKDYWTDADKAEIKSYVDEAILGGEW